jgi:dihydropteroate synthase
VVIGTSRKGFIGRITARASRRERLFGTAACVAWAVANGAAIVRVHDVGR